MGEEGLREAVAVVGAGAWGTTLAWLLSNQGREVRLWARRPEQAEAIATQRENRLRLPGVRLPDTVLVTEDLGQAVRGAPYVVVAVPSVHMRQVARRLGPCIGTDALVVSATKGLEVGSGLRMSQVLVQECGLDTGRVLALSGPNLSGEIVKGMPAVSVIAGLVPENTARCQGFFSSALFRIYASCDILGVEICGALKNILAIAAGVSDGLGYGANAKAALVTRGLAEIGRLGMVLGATRATFWGAAGVGDVLATCNSPLSRNWQMGYRLGRGESLAEITRSLGGVAEGVDTTAAARELAADAGVETPITNALHEVLFANRPPVDAVRELMTRRQRWEAEDWQ